jgi:hypothetical protein
MPKKIIRHELVEIIIPANSTLSRYNFPDIPNLRNSHILGLQLWDANTITTSPISQNPLLTAALAQTKTFITLVNYGGKEFLKQAPSVMFSTIQDDLGTSTNHHELDFKSFVGQRCNFPKCYIEATATLSTTVDRSFLVSIYYTLDIAQEQQENGYTFNKKG